MDCGFIKVLAPLCVRYALPTAAKLTNAFLLMKHIFPLKTGQMLAVMRVSRLLPCLLRLIKFDISLSKTFKMTTLLFQITFAPHGLEEKLGIVF